MYTIEYDEDWEQYFVHSSPELQVRFLKRKEKYKTFPNFGFRHEKHGVDYFVDEIGDDRVCFKSDENAKIRKFYFIGTHKEYEKFLGTRK